MGNWRQRMQKLTDAGKQIFASSPLPFLAWEGDGLLCVREKASGPTQWIWLPHAADDLAKTRRVLTETWHVPLHTVVMTASPAAVRYKAVEMGALNKRELGEMLRWEGERFFPDVTAPWIGTRSVPLAEERVRVLMAALTSDAVPDERLAALGVERVIVVPEVVALGEVLADSTGTVYCVASQMVAEYRERVWVDWRPNTIATTHSDASHEDEAIYVHGAGAASDIGATRPWPATIPAKLLGDTPSPWRDVAYLPVAAARAAQRPENAALCQTIRLENHAPQPAPSWFRPVLAGSLCILALAFGYAAFHYAMYQKEMSALQNETTVAQLSALRTQAAAYQTAVHDRQEHERTRLTASKLLLVICDSCPADVTLAEIRTENEDIIITGNFQSGAPLHDWSEYLSARLERPVRSKIDRHVAAAHTFTLWLGHAEEEANAIRH